MTTETTSTTGFQVGSDRGIIDLWELVLGSVVAGVAAPMLRSTDIFSMSNGKTVLSFAGSNIIGQVITKGAFMRTGKYYDVKSYGGLGYYTYDLIDAAITGVVFTGAEHFLREKGSIGKDFLIGFGSAIVGELINEYSFKRNRGKTTTLLGPQGEAIY